MKKHLKLFCLLAFFHASPLFAQNPCFSCETTIIDGKESFLSLEIYDNATARLRWFENELGTYSTCELSIIEGRYNAKAVTNDISFGFEKNECVSSKSETSDLLKVLDDPHLKISSMANDRHMSHFLVFEGLQPVRCNVDYADRKRLENMAQMAGQH